MKKENTKKNRKLKNREKNKKGRKEEKKKEEKKGEKKKRKKRKKNLNKRKETKREQEMIFKKSQNLYHGIKLWCIFCVKMAEEDKNNYKKGYKTTIDENVE